MGFREVQDLKLYRPGSRVPLFQALGHSTRSTGHFNPNIENSHWQPPPRELQRCCRSVCRVHLIHFEQLIVRVRHQTPGSNVAISDQSVQYCLVPRPALCQQLLMITSAAELVLTRGERMSSSLFLSYERRPAPDSEPLGDLVMARSTLDLFQPALFSMDNFDSGGSAVVTSLAAIFDLEGFTGFSSQNDPQLCVPAFLDDFIDWLFRTIKKLSIEKDLGETDVRLYAPLPFYAKFLGDGVLFLWEVDYKGIELFCRKAGQNLHLEVQGDVGNIISVLFDTCNMYQSEFCPKAGRKFARVPSQLRCGVAQGLVCSLGRGVDYVGPCINMAARLQKLGGLRVCISSRGFDLQLTPSEKLTEIFVAKKSLIRGTGEELLYVVRSEFEKLSEENRRLFEDP